MSKNYWILKSEADCYSIADLKKDGETFWDGVRNYQARNMLREDIAVGDECIFYHSNAEPSYAAGTCTVIKAGTPDVTQFDPGAEHYDPQSEEDKPRWYGVTVKYLSTLRRPVTLPAMHKNRVLKHMKLLQRGNRLSVLPLSKEEYDEILDMGK